MSFVKSFSFNLNRYSQTLLGLCFSVVIAASFSSCNIFKSSPHDRDDSVKVKETGSCVVDVRQTFKDYVNGIAKPNQVTSSLNCISHDLEQFKLRTQSSTSANQYSLTEMNAFFEKYFAGAQEFNLPSLTAYLKFKNFLLGGGELLISKDEITVIENVINDAEPILASMSQYINIYTLQTSLNLDDAEDAARMTQSIDCIHKLTRVLSKYFPGQNGSFFKFTDLDRLDFANQDVGSKVSDTEAIQLIMNLKSILVNPPEDSVKGEDFQHFLTQLDLILETGIRIKYTRDLNTYRSEKFLLNVKDLRSSTARLFQNSFSFQANQSISYVELTKFLKKLDRYSLIPFGLKEDSVEQFLPTLLSKILAQNPAQTPVSTADLNFKNEHLQTALDAFDEWISIQSLFLNSLSGRDDIYATDLIEKFTRGESTITQPKLILAYSQMKEVLSNGVLLRWKNKDQLNFAPRDKSQIFSRYDLLFLSSSFSIIRQIMRSFIVDPERRKSISSMTEVELTELYKEVCALGRDLKFIDTRNTLAPSRAFLETNIFMSVSNGNELVEFHEALEWLYQVWSAGNMGLKIYNLVPEKCKTQELDVFDQRKLDHTCYTSYFKAHVREFFDNLPNVSIYLSQALSGTTPPPTNQKRPSLDPWNDFDVALENAFRPAGHSNADFDSPDTEAMALVLSYTESVFINHSHAHNGELDTNDVWDTYPLMRGFIERASNGAANNEFIKKAAYSYLISFGEMPNADNIKNIIKFGSWSVLRNFHHEIAYVGDIVKVVSTFSLASRETKIKAVETYFNANKNTIESDVRNQNPKTLEDLRGLLFCSEKTQEYLSITLSSNADLIFTHDILFNATAFHKTIERIIVSDPKLSLECLSFE